ncbi:MAG: hypothetical protein CYPHOPRED_004593 [Cyphobasidiales sp. Tagirdzhanova-0007]|nr:MAG: hypothetical protein CYPHOPRED_004593 [Cyphobasidiales sp. Tagirdzhanova-0007]
MTTTGTFHYLEPQSLSHDGKPWVTVNPDAKTDVEPDVSSFKHRAVQKSVLNVRGHESDFSNIDTAGFAVYNYPSSVPEEAFFAEEDQVIRTAYYQEVEEILWSKLSGVKKVVIFDHTVRKREQDSARQPVLKVHIDQTPSAAEARVKRHLPDSEADKLLKGRYQIINVWRPIGHPASDHPLAVIDWRSTTPADLIPIDILLPKQDNDPQDNNRSKRALPDPASGRSPPGYEVKGEFYGLVPSEKHQFYYFKDMTPDEVMFVKCYDAHSEGQPAGRQTISAVGAHSAFMDPATSESASGRQSIEVRCLVFYDE